VKFTSNLNDAISVSDSNVGTISGNVFNSGSQYNLYGVDVNSLVIEHNTFNQIGPYAVDIAPSSTNTLSAISILSNQFNYTQIQGNQLGAISVSGISSSSINSNTFSLPAAAPTNTYRGAIALTGGGSVGKCINVAIESNLCNCNAPQGNATISISGNGSSLAVENIYVEANTINMSAAWPSNTEMPSAIWAYGSAGSMKNIQVIANSIKAPGQAWPVGIMAGASPASDAANDISGLNISKNIINGCSYGIYVDGSTTTTVDSNSITGCQGDGIYVDYNTAGTLAVIGNNVSNCGLAPTNSGNLNWYNETAAIMVVGSTVYGVTIEKNTYGTAAQANNLMFFLFCDVPSMQKVATAKNVTTTTLPSYISL
jgi:parallel beta-helix repeat protein